MKCADCLHYVGDKENDYGECRAHPPQSELFSTFFLKKTQWVFPLVLEDEWCGEWTDNLITR